MTSTSFTRELECGGQILQIKQLYIGDVGCVVWDAALVLSKFLENAAFFPRAVGGVDGGVAPAYWKGKRVIELGSGTGVVGLAAAVMGADVIITDLPEFLELMSSNVESNSKVLEGKVEAKVLKWGEEICDDIVKFKPDFILISDVVYYEESLEGLLKSLLELCHEHTTVIMAYEQRETGNKPQIEQKFFQMMGGKFKRKDIAYEDLDETFRSPDIHVIFFNLLSL